MKTPCGLDVDKLRAAYATEGLGFPAGSLDLGRCTAAYCPECYPERAMAMAGPQAGTRLETARRQLPGAVLRITEFVVDNPGQCALLAAGTVVVTAMARNLVKPRTVLEMLALHAVLTASAPLVAEQVVKRGWLTFRVRDADGNLITVHPEEEN